MACLWSVDLCYHPGQMKIFVRDVGAGATAMSQQKAFLPISACLGEEEPHAGSTVRLCGAHTLRRSCVSSLTLQLGVGPTSLATLQM